jgi:ribulose-phosphate 3-epimerase
VTSSPVSRSVARAGRVLEFGQETMGGVVASILDCDFTRLAEEVEAVDAHVDRFQIDVMDGHFVPNLSFGFPILRAMRRLTRKPLEADLMIDNPDRYAAKYAEAGADFVIIHVEVSRDPRRTFEEIRGAGGRPGISLSPGTPATAVYDHLGEVDMVLVMTVRPGFGGQAFMTEQLAVVEQIRRRLEETGREIPIEVDGGVKADTIGAAAAAGASLFVAGSFIFHSKNYERAIRALRDGISGCPRLDPDLEQIEKRLDREFGLRDDRAQRANRKIVPVYRYDDPDPWLARMSQDVMASLDMVDIETGAPKGGNDGGTANRRKPTGHARSSLTRTGSVKGSGSVTSLAGNASPSLSRLSRYAPTASAAMARASPSVSP